ncbi:Protein zwilch [Nymphon striatum]|nr:Protein zwilch [Nymphon striatum]
MSSELTTLEHVNPLLPVNDSDFIEQINQLRKLLHVIELIACCKTSLGLPKEVLSNICRKCLEYYKDVKVIDPDHIFEFFLPMTLVKDLYSRLDLENWVMHLNSSDGSYEVNTIINMSPKSLFPFVFEKIDLAFDNDLNNTEESYYMATVTSVSDHN